jgi:DNA-binding response OmpR family regulator/KaiC/GvpD/RAD55 family RecA-like ATPase
MMKATSRNIIPSGVEPVDKLVGGLEGGQLYLVHGDASGKSLFGIKFLIEGLKRGENAALVIDYSQEDAARRFARLGYDFVEDSNSGRLIALECSGDVIRQGLAQMQDMTPILSELEWELSETRPLRIVFDPVGSLVSGEGGELGARAKEFAAWARSFGATVVLIANGESREVVEHFKPLVEQSFRFEVRECGDSATRFLAFEKSADIPDQPIEVDPARGVFLLGRVQAQEPPARLVEDEAVPQPPPVAHTTAGYGEPLLDIQEDEPPADGLNVDLMGLDLITDFDAAGPAVEQTGGEPLKHKYDFFKPADLSYEQPTVRPEAGGRAGATGSSSRDTMPLDGPPQPGQAAAHGDKPASAHQAPALDPDELSKMLDDLACELSPLELDALDWARSPGETSADDNREAHGREAAAGEAAVAPPADDQAAQDSDIDSVITARAVEILLRPPDSKAELSWPEGAGARAQAQAAPSPADAVDPKDFNVLVIDDNPASCELLAQSLGEYTVEIVHDGVSGLAKLISFKPDLVIIDIDLPIIDGFKVLAHIRTSLNMPIIVMSGSHMRASDRVRSTDLGADYYMTKPFSVKELRQKVRQLIARHRGISSWIISSPPGAESRATAYDLDRGEYDAARSAAHIHSSLLNGGGHFISYEEFASRLEKKVRAALDNGATFSVVGCRLPNMTAYGGLVAIHLYELVSGLVRESDVISTNQRNDLVILLADADAAGARAFINRLRERVAEEVNQEPAVWMRSFPDLEGEVEPASHDHLSSNGGNLNRRVSDRHDLEGRTELHSFIDPAGPEAAGRAEGAGGRRSPEPYIDLLKLL